MKAKKNVIRLGFLVGIAAWLVFLSFQAHGIYTGDTGDLVTAAYQFGVPHPPGYPLYTFLAWAAIHIPIATVAWRVTLLSSLPHAVAVALVFFLVSRLTKSTLSALFAASVLGGNYLFFLYGVTPEVFALFDLFVISLVYLLVVWSQTGDTRYLTAASFVFGLSLTHHHVILFMLPAYIWWIFVTVRTSKISGRKLRQSVLFSLAALLLGLLPYAYIPLAAHGSSIVNWDKATDMTNFLRLLTRRDYGTFTSGSIYSQLLTERLLEVKAYVQFLLMDTTWVGVGLAAAGGVWLWKNSRRFLWFILLSLACIGPFFFFYAGFPLVNRFMLGTYERFMLPSYVVLSVVVGVGIYQITLWVGRLVGQLPARLPRSQLVSCIVAVFWIYPISTLGMNVWRFWGLPQDRTAQHLATDVLWTVPPNSIVLLSRDTTLFTTQYVRYVLGERPDVMVLMLNNIHDLQYRKVIASVFPQLAIPDREDTSFLEEFIKANSSFRPIYTNSELSISNAWNLVPYGLLYKIVLKSSVPPLAELLRINGSLWKTYHDPTAGILSRYNHLMLSDVRDVYTTSRIAWGKYLLAANELSEAEVQFETAVSYSGDIQLADAHTYLGLTRLFRSQCAGALESFANARRVAATPDAKLLYYEAVTYRDCLADGVRAGELFSQYEKQTRTREVPLEGL